MADNVNGIKKGDYVVLASEVEEAKKNKSLHPLRKKVLDFFKGFPFDKFHSSFQNFEKKLRELYGDYVDKGEWVELSTSGYQFWPVIDLVKMEPMGENTMAVKDSYSANEAEGTGAELAAVTKIIGKDKLAKFIKAGYKSEFIDHAQDGLMDYYMGKKTPLKDKEAGEFYSSMSGRGAKLDPYQWYHKRLKSIAGTSMEENTERTSEFSAVLDTLPSELQKGYLHMNDADKNVLHSIVAHMTQKKENISESRSLLKDAPATADPTDNGEKKEPLKAEPKEEPKAEPEKKEVPAKEEPKATDEAEKIFTKKHYAPIAKILKTGKDKKEIVNQVAKLFKSQNEMFDESKFVSFTGVEKE